MPRSLLSAALFFWLAPLATADEPQAFGEHKSWVGAVAFSPDGTTLASGSGDGSAVVWEMGRYMTLAVCKGHTDCVTSVAFADKGATLVTGSFDGTARLWDAATGKLRHVLLGHRGAILAVASSPDGATVATGGFDGNVRLWEAATGKELGVIARHRTWVNGLAFSPDGKRLISVGSDMRVLAQDLTKERAHRGVRVGQRDGEIRCVAISADSRFVAVGTRFGTITVWSLPEFTEVASFHGHDAEIWSVAFAPDGKTLASGNGDWDRPGVVKLWDTKTWKLRDKLDHTGEVLSLAYSPNGKMLAAGSWDRTVRLWNLAKPSPALESSHRERLPVLLDTDLGSDIDDAFALGLILASPELDLRGVTTVGSDPEIRALMACRFLTMTGRRSVPVAAGAKPQPEGPINPTGMYRYYYHPDVLFNRTTRPQKESAVDFLYARLKASPGKLTIIATGPLTNIARLLTEKPECKPWIRRIIATGGSLAGPADTNFRADPAAARIVLGADVPLVLVPLEATAKLQLDADAQRRVFAPATALSLQIQALFQLWDQPTPGLADVLTAALCVNEDFGTLEKRCLEIGDNGTPRLAKGKPNAEVVTAVDAPRFLKWYVERLENCVAPAQRPAKLIATGAFPNRVHVAEDFDTDIERFWWMSGKAETKNLPPGNTRACRGTLTHDFDDLLGNPKAMYTAVVFNPVPGPPMGKQPRLSFRYWLKGTDTMRVQIYSLTNGYHRHLIVKDLPQGRWESGTVDMTLARRPDGTGGPLSEGERIDDIQFYVDPTAELLIDDIILYDAAESEEKQPFPKHIHYAATFDTGDQAKHWPGDLDLVPDKGFLWRAARSVDKSSLGTPQLRLEMRGARPLGAKTRLSFRYRLTGTDHMQVELRHRRARSGSAVELKELDQDRWLRANVDFNDAGGNADELLFVLPRGAELLLDDVILYEP